MLPPKIVSHQRTVVGFQDSREGFGNKETRGGVSLGVVYYFGKLFEVKNWPESIHLLPPSQVRSTALPH